MKKSRTAVNSKSNFDILLATLSDRELLNVKEMRCVRGGEGDAIPPIILPPPVRP